MLMNPNLMSVTLNCRLNKILNNYLKYIQYKQFDADDAVIFKPYYLDGSSMI
jgi:hypothetical protein